MIIIWEDLSGQTVITPRISYTELWEDGNRVFYTGQARIQHIAFKAYRHPILRGLRRVICSLCRLTALCTQTRRRRRRRGRENNNPRLIRRKGDRLPCRRILPNQAGDQPDPTKLGAPKDLRQRDFSRIALTLPTYSIGTRTWARGGWYTATRHENKTLPSATGLPIGEQPGRGGWIGG